MKPQKKQLVFINLKEIEKSFINIFFKIITRTTKLKKLITKEKKINIEFTEIDKIIKTKKVVAVLKKKKRKREY